MRIIVQNSVIMIDIECCHELRQKTKAQVLIQVVVYVAMSLIIARNSVIMILAGVKVPQ